MSGCIPLVALGRIKGVAPAYGKFAVVYHLCQWRNGRRGKLKPCFFYGFKSRFLYFTRVMEWQTSRTQDVDFAGSNPAAGTTLCLYSSTGRATALQAAGWRFKSFYRHENILSKYIKNSYLQCFKIWNRGTTMIKCIHKIRRCGSIGRAVDL